MSHERAELKLVAPSASPEEAAAVVAALERFMRATAAPPQVAAEGGEEWQRTAIVEAVRREPDRTAAHPWINT